MDRKDYGTITKPLQAIKTFCVEECNCGHYNYAKTCVDPQCPLYAFRLGKNPYINRKKYTDEEKKALAERFRKKESL